MRIKPQRSREVEVEFGFRYCKRDIRWKIIKMANEIADLRSKLERKDNQLKSLREQLRESELTVSNLEYKLRG